MYKEVSFLVVLSTIYSLVHYFYLGTLIMSAVSDISSDIKLK